MFEVIVVIALVVLGCSVTVLNVRNGLAYDRIRMLENQNKRFGKYITELEVIVVSLNK